MAKRHGENVEETGVTVRPSATAVFAVDSDDRYKTYAERRTRPSYPFSFSITKNESLLNGYFTRISVPEIRLYWTLPNISAAWGNNTLTYWNSVSGTPSTITIPDGFYDLELLMATIQDLIQADGSLTAFTAVSNVDGSSSYATTTADTFYWVAPTVNQRTLYDMLNLITTAAATTGRGGVANLKATDFVDIVSPQLTYNQDLKDATSAPTNRDVLCRVYLDDPTKSQGRYNTNVFSGGPPPALSGYTVGAYDITTFTNGCTPFVIERQFSQPKQILWNKTQPLGNITFQMYDDQGREIQALWSAAYPIGVTASGTYYANSFVWNMTLLVSEN
jgi:hypothetical protein